MFYKGSKETTQKAVDVDPDRHQMPKRSRAYDRLTKTMLKAASPLAKKAKSTDTHTEIKAASPPAKKAKSTDTHTEIKPAGETPDEVKKRIIDQMIKEGKVRRTRSYDFSKE